MDTGPSATLLPPAEGRSDEGQGRVGMCGAAAATLAMALSAGAAAAQESARPLFVRASLSTAGPYGESWYLVLTPDGEAHLQVFYSSNPSGNLLGRFSLGPERLRR